MSMKEWLFWTVAVVVLVSLPLPSSVVGDGGCDNACRERQEFMVATEPSKFTPKTCLPCVNGACLPNILDPFNVNYCFNNSGTTTLDVYEYATTPCDTIPINGTCEAIVGGDILVTSTLNYVRYCTLVGPSD